MDDRVISPDGKYLWTGEKWIPLPVESKIEISDSIVQGDILQETNINLNYKNEEKVVDNFLDLALDKISRGDFEAAEDAFQSAKEVNVKLALACFEGRRANEISEAYLPYIWRSVEDAVRVVTDRAEASMESLSIISIKSENLTSIIIKEINRLEAARKYLLNIGNSSQGMQPPNKINVDSAIEGNEGPDISSALSLVDATIMEVRGLGEIFCECCVISLNKSKAKVNAAIKIDLSTRTQIEISISRLSGLSMTKTSIQENESIIELRGELPQPDDVTKKFREKSLKMELESLKSSINVIEMVKFSTTGLYDGTVMTTGEVELLSKYNQIRVDLGRIATHAETRSWDVFKTTPIESELYHGSGDSNPGTTHPWMASAEEIDSTISEKSIPQIKLDEHELVEMSILLESCYRVGDISGRLANLISPAFGKVASIGSEYYVDLVVALKTQANVIRSLLHAMQCTMDEYSWQEILDRQPTEVLEAGENGIILVSESLKVKSPCFIATAAYGSELHWKIDVLRNWRDQTLRKSVIGRSFIRTYYRFSPPVAKVIARYRALRLLTRLILFPVVGLFSLRYDTLRHSETKKLP